MTDDFNWLVEHGADVVRDYAGKWIAVCDGQVVGVGETATEAADKARSTVGDKSFILEAVEAEADVIYANRQTALDLIIENVDAGQAPSRLGRLWECNPQFERRARNPRRLCLETIVGQCIIEHLYGKLPVFS